MNFIQSCFIRKNTPELRKKLEELGYLPPSEVWHDENFAICTIFRDNKGEYFTFKIDDDFERIIVPSYPYIDCGDNEELFFALAALRDDSDKNQWIIDEVNEGFEDSWMICDRDNMNDRCVYTHYRKASVKEIIEHFKYDRNQRRKS